MLTFQKPQAINVVFPELCFSSQTLQPRKSLGLKTLLHLNKRGDVGAGISPVRFIQEGLCSGDGGLNTGDLVMSR